MRLLYSTLLTLKTCSLSCILLIQASSATAIDSDYVLTSSTIETDTLQNFVPIVDTDDYVRICGSHKTTSSSPVLQRVSRNWQRCYAYTSAVLSTMRDLERNTPFKQFCVPDNVSVEYAIDIAVSHAKKQPETYPDNPATTVLNALAARYLCQ